MEPPHMAAVVGTQLANTPLLQELRTQSSLVKVASDRRTLKQLHSQVLPHDAMQVLVAVLLEWALMIIPTHGPLAVDDQQFDWNREQTTSWLLVAVVVVATTLPVAQAAGQREFLVAAAAVLKLLAELVLLVVVNPEPQESNTQVVTPEQLQQVRNLAKEVAVAVAGTAVAAVATTPVVVVALATLHFSLVVPLRREAELLPG
jgi:ABC-type phosphate/phosphonate transport system permease subunit